MAERARQLVLEPYLVLLNGVRSSPYKFIVVGCCKHYKFIRDLLKRKLYMNNTEIFENIKVLISLI